MNYGNTKWQNNYGQNDYTKKFPFKFIVIICQTQKYIICDYSATSLLIHVESLRTTLRLKEGFMLNGVEA